VAERVRRLNLPPRKGPRLVAATLPALAAAPRQAAHPNPRGLPRVTRLNYQHRTCQFIAGKPAGAATRFCAAVVLRGSSYCPDHHARCWSISERRVAA
jgi:hypothetical protein